MVIRSFKVAAAYCMSSPSRNESNLFRSGQLLITSWYWCNTCNDEKKIKYPPTNEQTSRDGRGLYSRATYHTWGRGGTWELIMCFVAVKLFVKRTLPTAVRGVLVWTFGERLYDMQFVELEHPRLVRLHTTTSKTIMYSDYYSCLLNTIKLLKSDIYMWNFHIYVQTTIYPSIRVNSPFHG